MRANAEHLTFREGSCFNLGKQGLRRHAVKQHPHSIFQVVIRNFVFHSLTIQYGSL